MLYIRLDNNNAVMKVTFENIRKASSAVNQSTNNYNDRTLPPSPGGLCACNVGLGCPSVKRIGMMNPQVIRLSGIPARRWLGSG